MDGKAIVDRWRLDHWPHLRHDEIVGTDALVSAIDSALAKARAEEREACAKVAEEYASTHTLDSWDFGLLPTHDAHGERGKKSAGLDIAIAIRALGTL